MRALESRGLGQRECIKNAHGVAGGNLAVGGSRYAALDGGGDAVGQAP